MRTIRSSLLLASAISALSTAGVVHAQASQNSVNENTESTDNNGASIEIVVTGSSIRGAAPVGSNVIGVSRDNIITAGPVNTAQILQRIPQVLNNGVSENSQAQSGGSSNVGFSTGLNLRGLGPTATLTLVNGHRVIGGGTASDTPFNPNNIPTIALSRVEVVADGASAIYGSDAVAGVVNLIMRRDIRNLEVSGRYGVGDSYHNAQLGAAIGHNWGSGQISLAYEFTERGMLSAKDRSFFSSDLRTNGGGDYRSDYCPLANIVQSDQTYAVPVGGVTQATASQFIVGVPNRCDLARTGSILPRQRLHSIAGTLDQTIAPGVSVFADGYATWRKYTFNVAAPFGEFIVPTSNAFYTLPPGANAADPQAVRISFGDIGLTDVVSGFANAFQINGGVRIDLTSNLQLTGFVTAAHSRAVSSQVNVDPGAVANALASSDPATALDVYGRGRTSAATIASLQDTQEFRPDGTGDVVQAGAKIDGKLATLPGGDLRVAIGAESFFQKFVGGFNFGPRPLGPPITTTNRRTVRSLYGEMLLPLFGPDNATAGFERLELTGAVRYDHYDGGIGGTTNPKFGANWVPLDGLKLRATYGTSFRAPTQPSNSQTLLYTQTYIDPLSPTGTTLGFALSSNPTLRPEKARTITFGADIEPNLIPGLRVSLTYFDIYFRDQIASYLSDLTLLTRSDLFGALINRAPDQAYIQSFIDAGMVIGALPAAPYTLLVDGSELNLGSTKMRGLDFDISYRFSNRLGDFNVGLAGTRNFSYGIQYTPGGRRVEVLNTIFNPARFRARGELSWQRGGWAGLAFVNYTNAYTNDRGTGAPQRVRANMTIDLDLSYTVDAGGSSPLHDLRIGVNVDNLFNRKPPFVDLFSYGYSVSSAGYDPTSGDPIGRVVSLGVSKKF
jgi:iron complex outermembrane receptor protein